METKLDENEYERNMNTFNSEQKETEVDLNIDHSDEPKLNN